MTCEGQLDTLPETSFLPFRVEPLLGAHLAWHNAGLKAPQDLSRLQVRAGATTGDGAHQPSVALAERYGGRGIGANGGGARCGLVGDVQIKGIGRTPAASDFTSYWYSHGAVTLEEAWRESILGEVCHEALPFGGVRAYGIVDTGLSAPVEGAAGVVDHAPGALLLRQAKLRPGHYMAAPLHRMNIEQAAGWPSDAKRVSRAIGVIALGADACGYQSVPPHGGLLKQIAERFARQAAAARAKRIVHGALSCSNIALDGAYMDFGTLTTVSDYGPIIVARGHPDATHEQEELYPTLYDLAFYCNKYGIGDQEHCPPAALVAHFEERFQNRLAIEFLKLTGIPEAALQWLDGDVGRQLCVEFGRLTVTGMCSPFKLREMPASMTSCPLSAVLRRLSTASNEGQACSRLSELGLPGHDASRIAACFRRAISQVLSRVAPHRRADIADFIAVNGYRLNLPLDPLYRPNLVRSISAAMAQGESACATLVDRCTRFARLACADAGPDGIDLSLLGEPLVLTTTNPLKTDSGKRSRVLLDDLEESFVSSTYQFGSF